MLSTIIELSVGYRDTSLKGVINSLKIVFEVSCEGRTGVLEVDNEVDHKQ